jgi:PAS domain S-box-containing protein
VAIMERLTAWVRGLVPSQVSARVTRLFTLMAFLQIPLVAAGSLNVAIYEQLSTVVALAAIGVWLWVLCCRGGASRWWDLLPPSALLVVAWSLGHGPAIRGLLLTVLLTRVLHGDRRDAVLNGALYFAAFVAALALTGAALGSAILEGLMVPVVAVVAWTLARVLREFEQTSAREVNLAEARLRLQSASDSDAVFAAAVEGARSILSVYGEETAITLWRGDAETLVLAHGDGDVPGDLPPRVPLATISPELRASLLAGAPFRLDEAASRAVQTAVGMAPIHMSILIAPFTHGDSFSGALAVSSRAPLSGASVDALGQLALGVGLVLDRMERSALLQRIVDNSSDAILLLRDDHTIRYVSEAISPILGYARSDLIDRPFDDLMAGSDEAVSALLERAEAATVLRDPVDVVLRHADGRVLEIELAASQLTDTPRPGWVLNLRDVTVRRETERALRLSEAHLRTLAENVSEGLFRMSFNPAPQFDYVNPALEDICGLTARQMLDDPDVTLRHVHPDDRDLLMQTRTDPESITWPIEIRWNHPERGWRWLSLTETPIFGDDGGSRLSLGIASDITARREQEEALRYALVAERSIAAKLRQVDEMKTTFLQAVSHELRTPLTAIIGYAHTLERTGAGADDPQQRMMLERLTASATRLRGLLIDLLDVDRLSAGVIEPNRRPTDVTALCLRVVEQMEGDAHAVTCVGDPVTADVDGPKIERVVENLLRNAIRHSPDGTVVDVEVTDLDHDVLIAVTDRGPGVEPQHRERIFEVFEQGPEAAASPSPGTGIGLSLVAKFVQLHGGVVWVENAPTGGARFCVRLPKRPPRDLSSARPGEGISSSV